MGTEMYITGFGTMCQVPTSYSMLHYSVATGRVGQYIHLINRCTMIVQLITSRESMLKDPTTKPIKRFKLEWELQGLRNDVQRWKEALDIICKTLTEECTS